MPIFKENDYYNETIEEQFLVLNDREMFCFIY